MAAAPSSSKQRLESMNFGKLPGKQLAYNSALKKWDSRPFKEIYPFLNANPAISPRILFVESSYDRKKRLRENSIDPDNEDPQSLEWFCEDDQCRKYMIDILQFPDYLFEPSWYNSNGFAGSKHIEPGCVDLSWFRILVKWVSGLRKNDYRWHEMTFFVHQPDMGELTVIAFEGPDHEIGGTGGTQIQTNGNTTTIAVQREKKGPFKPDVEPYNFCAELCEELTRRSKDDASWKPEWRYMNAMLLKQSITVIDRAVWACSKTVRHLEKNRSDRKTALSATAFNFPNLHNLLRHALHLAETLEVASNTLHPWIKAYAQAQRRKAVPPLQDGDDLPANTYHDSLTQSLQLLSNLKSRSASNEARLRNEISLAFNLVSQADTRAMRTISLITLLFLPATFISTLFSMSFFDYSPGGGGMDGWGVTKMIWIYVAVAVPLTILAILLWFFGEKWMAALERKFRRGGDEDE